MFKTIIGWGYHHFHDRQVCQRVLPTFYVFRLARLAIVVFFAGLLQCIDPVAKFEQHDKKLSGLLVRN